MIDNRDSIKPSDEFLSECSKFETVMVHAEIDIADAVRTTFGVATELGFRKSEQFLVATSVSELARNAYQYGGGGMVFLGRSDIVPLKLVVEVIDQGPGIEDIDEAMQDNFSTGGTLGLGLPGVQRMMDHFEIESSLGKGTRIFCYKARPSHG